MSLIRVLIVEDFERWATLLHSIVASDPLMHIIGVVSDGQAALQVAEEHNPDILLIDIGLPGLNGIELARAAQVINPRPTIVFVSQHTTPAIVTNALEAGALGYVLKIDVAAELLQGLHAAHRGELFLSTSIKKLASHE